MTIFFFKQRTAYDSEYGLVGSEMCIRDSLQTDAWPSFGLKDDPAYPVRVHFAPRACLLYTSDAADALLCVDLAGRRIIKKKKNTHDT